jgi:DNA-binding LacI/PurR family transcriptional regulator
MASPHRLSAAEQIAGYLREELRTGRWNGILPTVRQLAAELDTSKTSVSEAFWLLEAEGTITSDGPRRPYRTVESDGSAGPRRVVKVGVLLYDRLEDESGPNVGQLMDIIRCLERAGNVCVIAPKCQKELRHSVTRIARMLAKITVDAWLVWAGVKQVLEWFSRQPVPVFAFGGNSLGLPIAGSALDTASPIDEVTRHLISLGHRRIVMLVNSSNRIPIPGRMPRRFIQTLADAGIVADSYHLPDWEESPQGLQTLLKSLFLLTPPTALIAGQPYHINGILSFLNQRGLVTPQDLSLVAVFLTGSLEWCQPPLAHFRWRRELFTREIARWVQGVARGCPHRKQKLIPCEFVPSESIACPRR